MKSLTALVSIGTGLFIGALTGVTSYFATGHFREDFSNRIERYSLQAESRQSAHEFWESRERLNDTISRDVLYATPENFPAVFACSELASTLDQFILSKKSDKNHKSAQAWDEREKTCENEYQQSSIPIWRDTALNDCLRASLRDSIQDDLALFQVVLLEIHGLKKAYDSCIFSAWDKSSTPSEKRTNPAVDNSTTDDSAIIYTPKNAGKCSQREASRLEKQAVLFDKEAKQKMAKFNSWIEEGATYMDTLKQQDFQAYKLASICWIEVQKRRYACAREYAEQLDEVIEIGAATKKCNQLPLAEVEQCLCVTSIPFRRLKIKSSQGAIDCYQQILTRYSQCPKGITTSD